MKLIIILSYAAVVLAFPGPTPEDIGGVSRVPSRGKNPSSGAARGGGGNGNNGSQEGGTGKVRGNGGH
ncbi:hypothetical protein Vi05172_g9844 [Venturia inaequalis]|nr:hypothetical protein Vi05172_g9844 [Venturia inaequalis]